MTKQQACGTSTIAMTAYNIIAQSLEPLPPEVILTIGKAKAHPDLKEDQLKEALNRLVDMKYVNEKNGGYSGKDPKRRIIVERDRSDAWIDEETGEITGGWNDWMAKDNERGLIPIKEATCLFIFVARMALPIRV